MFWMKPQNVDLNIEPNHKKMHHCKSKSTNLTKIIELYEMNLQKDFSLNWYMLHNVVSL